MNRYVSSWASTAGLAVAAVIGVGCCANAAAAQRAQIEALYSTTISSEVSGRIDDIGYREGESFKKGATLASIDCTSYAAERDRVAAKLASAQAKRDNQEQLARLESAGKLEVDLARLSVNETSAELRAARANVARCNINAPFAGRVNSLEASLGQSTKPQDKLMTIVGEELNARVIVPANWLSWLKKRRYSQSVGLGNRYAGDRPRRAHRRRGRPGQPHHPDLGPLGQDRRPAAGHDRTGSIPRRAQGR